MHHSPRKLASKRGFVSRIFACIATVLLLCDVSFGQKMDLEYHCAFQSQGNLRSNSTIVFTGADSIAKEYVGSIMEFLDIPPNFVLKIGNVPNVSAAIHKGKRYLIVNKELMWDLSRSSSPNWEGLCMILYGIGHHVMGHSLTSSSHTAENERMADEFAGLVLAKMGASKMEAISPFLKSEARITRGQGSMNQARINSITKGWTRYNGKRLQYGHKITGGSGPKKVTRTSEKGQFYVHESWVEHQAFDEEGKGLNIHVDFEATGFKGSTCRVSALIYHSSGSPLLDRDLKYTTKRGQVAIKKSIIPGLEKNRYADFVMFIPYSQLHINSHYQQNLKVMIVLENSSEKVIHRGAIKDFWYKDKKSGDLNSNSKGDQSINKRMMQSKSMR